jgi:hypothetical protein
MSDNPEVDWEKVTANIIGSTTIIAYTLVEQRLIDLKGMEHPGDSYSKGYRDAIDMMLIQIRRMIETQKQTGKHIPEWKPNE